MHENRPRQFSALALHFQAAGLIYGHVKRGALYSPKLDGKEGARFFGPAVYERKRIPQYCTKE